MLLEIGIDDHVLGEIPEMNVLAGTGPVLVVQNDMEHFMDQQTDQLIRRHFADKITVEKQGEAAV